MKRVEQHRVVVAHDDVTCTCKGPGGAHEGQIAPPFPTVYKWLAVEVEDGKEART